MINKDIFNLDTNVTVTVIDVTSGQVIDTIKKHNLITTLGKNMVASLLGIDGTTGLTYIAIGTDDTAATVADTTLGTEVFRDVYTDVIYDTAKVTYKYYLSSSDANGNTLVEAGLFGDDADGDPDTGILFAHVIHSEIVKTSSIAITYSWEISIS